MFLESKLPKWYPLQKLHGSVNLDQLVEAGKKRVDFLLSIARDREEAFLKSNEDVLNPLGCFSLIITAALSEDNLFKLWFLEHEGDFFSYWMERASIGDKIAIIKDLLGDNVIIGWKEITSRLGISRDDILKELAVLLPSDTRRKETMTKLYTDIYRNELGGVAVKFWEVPWLLIKHRGFPHKGWIVTTMRFLLAEIKKCFQTKLEARIKHLSQRKKEGDTKVLILQEVAERILSYWREKRDLMSIKYKDFKVVGEKLYEREDLWPLCMKILINRLRTSGYLTHGERLQLGLFLKKLGMSLEEQLQLWYKSAVDNFGMSWEEFERKGGYYIKHIYGLVGGRKDYEAPKCETIIAKYFCPFKSLSSEQLKEILKNMHQEMPDKVLVTILRRMREGEARKACSEYLSFLMGRRYEKEMSHPLLFVRLLYMREKKRKRREARESGSTPHAGESKKGGSGSRAGA
ncbi:MAG: hypothetical protein ACTSX9_01410 [Candidatus Njordarchaeales archaeon]